MRISNAAAVSKKIPPRAVYSGQERLGTIEQHDWEYIARGRRGALIGCYDSALEAANAISEAALP